MADELGKFRNPKAENHGPESEDIKSDETGKIRKWLNLADRILDSTPKTEEQQAADGEPPDPSTSKKGSAA